MQNDVIQGKTIQEWEEAFPLMHDIISMDEVLWTNPDYENFADAIQKISLTEKDVEDAAERLNRFAPYSCRRSCGWQSFRFRLKNVRTCHKRILYYKKCTIISAIKLVIRYRKHFIRTLCFSWNVWTCAVIQG